MPHSMKRKRKAAPVDNSESTAPSHSHISTSVTSPRKPETMHDNRLTGPQLKPTASAQKRLVSSQLKPAVPADQHLSSPQLKTAAAEASGRQPTAAPLELSKSSSSPKVSPAKREGPKLEPVPMPNSKKKPRTDQAMVAEKIVAATASHVPKNPKLRRTQEDSSVRPAVPVKKKIRLDRGKAKEVSTNWSSMKQQVAKQKTQPLAELAEPIRTATGQLVVSEPGVLWPPIGADLAGVSKEVGIDCEMVGVGEGGVRSVLARAAVVDYNGAPLMDLFVKPTETVTNYRCHITGIKPKDLVKAPSFAVVQKLVADITKDRIVVGHDLRHDFKVLMLDHPRRSTRDTARFKPLQFKGRARALRTLAEEYLGLDIQGAEHSPVEDARVAMQLYKLHQHQWEHDSKNKNKLFSKAGVGVTRPNPSRTKGGKTSAAADGAAAAAQRAPNTSFRI